MFIDWSKGLIVWVGGCAFCSDLSFLIVFVFRMKVDTKAGDDIIFIFQLKLSSIKFPKEAAEDEELNGRKKKKRKKDDRKKQSQTNLFRQGGEATVRQAQVSHLSGVSEGLWNSGGTQGEATNTNTKEALKRDFCFPQKQKRKFQSIIISFHNFSSFCFLAASAASI